MELKDFIVCCGYKGYMIKEYFSNFFLHSSDVTINLKKIQFGYTKNTQKIGTLL